MTQKIVLITGATGFLGGAILKALQARDDVTVVAACRNRSKLPADFSGEVRSGDLMDERYRRSVVRDVDVICHAAAWASMWGHAQMEQRRFYEPTCRLIDAAVESGVGRFILTSTVAVNEVRKVSVPLDDFGVTGYVNHWPHLNMLIDVDHYMRARATPSCQMVTLRLGHFIGRGNRLGLLPALVPRLKTHLVPWLDGGRRRMPLVADTDLGQAFALAALAEGLKEYESFNICGAEFPSMRELVTLIAEETGIPVPHFSVPYSIGYVFGWLMETLNPLLPGYPFLTRSIVHLSEEWLAPGDYAKAKLGYVPRKDWRVAVREHLADLKAEGYPWPRLSQAV
jgi:nucleoside-diphosphate-sugar epimerase